ncbi:patatin-like phospholipase family protein [Sphingomonas sp. Mn802worker]|uniref:patatin-like phospholipase family protein n=1 Tax=Sphingomonas sp. Mn802worker TaxID=629773 RepID=UPI0003A096B6|nr:patatin-like phospholipase family protein [Sphingomonas sp. Mn802worker]
MNRIAESEGVQKRVKPAFAIFEGGGAKGITHIGALKALEQNGYELVGAAGASAGAIIAALTAIGYTADELFDRYSDSDLLQSYGLKPLDLLGPRKWLWFNLLRKSAIWGLGLAILIVVSSMILEVRSSYSSLLLIGLLLSPSLLLTIPVLFGRGFLSTKQMREKLNDILRDRLKEHYINLGIEVEPPRYIRFSHIDPAIIPQCSGLKIIVSDARNNSLVQFDQSTPDVVVADAVAASAAIPFVFRPAHVRGAAADNDPIYVDGGLISNLPVWAFAAEKRALEREQQGSPIPIFAFTLGGKTEETGVQNNDKIEGRSFNALLAKLSRVRTHILAPLARLWSPFHDFLSHASSVIETGVFGSQSIIQDFIPDLTVVELQSPLGTLDFGCGRVEAGQAFDAGLNQAHTELHGAALMSDLVNGLLADLLERTADKIAARRAQVAAEKVVKKRSFQEVVSFKRRNKSSVEQPPPRLRLYLLQSLRGGSFKVSDSVSMDADSDDRMEYDARSKLGPRAFVERRPIYSEYAANPAALWMTKYERALASQDRRSIIAIPVFANPEARQIYGQRVPVQKALCLDSSDQLQSDFDDPVFLDWLNTEAVVFAQTMLKDLMDG